MTASTSKTALASAIAPASGLGIEKLLGLHYYVHDLERSRRFYVDALDFAEIGCSSERLEREGRQRSIVFSAGDIVIACSTPLAKGGRADRYLDKHPDGIGTVAFQVRDIQHAFDTLEARGGTPISEVQRFRDAEGELATFSITTPFGDTTFRFMQYAGYRTYFPGMLRYDEPRGGANRAGFTAIDHVTSNFQTMQPALLWLEHVLGFSPMWEVEFHTRDVMRENLGKHEVRDGSGLRSKVVWDPESGVKLANNEPYRPSFKSSQINIFHEQNRGDGVQHVALATRDITHAVRTLKGRGVHFMPTPRTYSEQLPARLRKLGIERLDEDLRDLEELQILVDGSGDNAYLLQIFLEDSAGLYGSAEAGPFFYELIQRKGDQGFGAGNFRALFESIEREQAAKGAG
jgi:4-hydroxyphenylpyruvate dioxygenase